MKTLRINPFGGYAFLSIAFVVLIGPFISGVQSVVTWDSLGYYWYLPQYFIYDSKMFTLDGIEMLRKQYHLCDTLYQFNLEKGVYVSRYTIGQSIFQFPFFIIAHFFALLFGLKADGFSSIYLVLQVIGSAFYFLVALYLLKKLLTHYTNDKTASIALLLVFFGTNLFYNYTHSVWYCSTHNYLFCGISYLFYFVDKIKTKPTNKSVWFAGVLCALIIITRPATVPVLVLLLFPLINNKFNYSLVKYFLLLTLGFFIPTLLQILHWKYQIGEWFYIGYKNTEEGFDFLGKHLLKNLFWFRKGWFIYTPLMFFACIGFIPLYKNNRSLFYVIFFYFITNLLIISSWSVWWWAESYGHRAMIESYALLLFPLAYFIEDAKRFRLRILLFSFLILLCILNLFKIWQYDKGIISQNRMSAAYYFKTFFSISNKNLPDSLLYVNRNYNDEEIPEYPNQYKKELLLSQDTIILNTQNHYPLSWKNSFKSLSPYDHVFLQVQIKNYSGDKSLKTLLVFHAIHKGASYKYLAKEIKVNKSGQELSYYYLSPEYRSHSDSITTYLWIKGEGKGKIEGFKLWLYKIKSN